MNTSPTIAKFAAALLDVQSRNPVNPHDEFPIIKQVARLSYSPKTNGTPFARFMSRIAYGASECWYWIGGISDLGYGRVGKGEHVAAHRASWTHFRGPIPEGMKVLHKCDLRCCVNPDHLFLGTQAENVADMFAKGRNRTTPQPGESNAMSVLTAVQVSQMRQIRKRTNLSHKKIAGLFNVSTMTAFRAITGQSWKKIS